MSVMKRTRPWSSQGPLKKRAFYRTAAANAVVVPAARVPQSTEIKYVDGYLDDTALQELHTNDTTWAGCEINPRAPSAVYGCLPVPRQGNDYASRDGRKIFVRNIKIRGILTWNPEVDSIGSSGQSFVRLVVVKDKRCNGVELSAEDVLAPGLSGDGTASLSADAAIMCMTNPNGWGRYQILKDKYIRIQPKTNAYDGTNIERFGYEVPFKINIKVNEYMNFDDSAGAVGSIVDNAYHLIGAASTDSGVVNISYLARTAFTG